MRPEDKADSGYSSSSDSGSDGGTNATTPVSASATKALGIKRIISASAALKELPSTTKSKKNKADTGGGDGNNKPKRKVYKKNNKSSWPNIFAQSKAVISLSNVKSSDPSHSGITINYCDSDFLCTFGYVDCGAGILLSGMMGKASSVDTLRKIESFLRLGRTATEYINLYRSDGTTPLSCHISLLPLKSNRDTIPAVPPSFARTTTENLLWGVITIRSASSVGNARFSGLSFLGMDRVSDTVRQEYYNNKILNDAAGSGTSGKSTTVTGKKTISRSKLDNESNSHEGSV